MACRTLIIDNFDSFTYNLFQYMGEVCGEEPAVVLNTEDFATLDFARYDCVIVSPGPGTPARPVDVGISVKAILNAQVPLLGVCLGHQCMAYIHGMEVAHAPVPMHGRVSAIHHDNEGIFKGLPPELSVVRYHSLVVRDLKDPFVITAWDQDGMIHGIRHKTRALYGIQFHPESICTEAGMDLLRNFRDIAMSHKSRRSVQNNHLVA
ncbi:aminodeoxychorismate/anthranilate synthase component II [Sorangium sp. So ce302]|uniref:anthranilate synthase component II n=1 Tax=unclassified Sorangium TaxID=2621164 RepID=UPI003F619365